MSHTGTPIAPISACDKRAYHFDAAQPWRSLMWLSRQVELPAIAMTETATFR